MSLENDTMIHTRLIVLLAVHLPLIVPLSCGSSQDRPPGPAEPVSGATEGAPGEPSPAALAFRSLRALPADAGAEAKLSMLAQGFIRHTERLAARARDRLAIRAGYGSMPEEKRRKYLEVMCGGSLMAEDYVEFKLFNEKVNRQAQHEFGLSWSELREKAPASLRDIWIARSRNWSDLLPKGHRISGTVVERDYGDSVHLIFEGRPWFEIEMVKESGGYRYGGTWLDRYDYMVGPERVHLFEHKTADERLEAARDDLSEIQSGIVKFRQQHTRYPTAEEGLDALLADPGGLDPGPWVGPYAHHIYDPWGNRWLAGFPGKRNPASFDLWSLGPDGKDGTADDVANW